MLYFDTETCGFHGPIILIQYAEDDGPVVLHHVWGEKVKDTLTLIEKMCDTEVCGFNLAFDWFHICQLYTTLRQLDSESTPNILKYALAEPEAIRSDICCKPQNALDLMLVAQKTEFQTLMPRKSIRISRVPTLLAQPVIDELDKRLNLDPLYFMKRPDPYHPWMIQGCTTSDGEPDPGFKNLILQFRPSGALKTIIGKLQSRKDMTFYTDVAYAKQPVELGYAPYALAIGSPEDWKGAWPDVIQEHIDYWGADPDAQKYAHDDVIYTRFLREHFSEAQPGDKDSILACLVGAVRWRGYKIDIPKLKQLRADAEKIANSGKINYSSTAECRAYLEEVLDATERLVLIQNGKLTTKSIVLETISKWLKQDICSECEGMGCDLCVDGLVIVSDERHPAAERASEILKVRHAKKDIEVFDKLLTAGRFHASFKVIGALSSRMSGGDGLNAHGIRRDPEIRAAILQPDAGMVVSGGDFESQEVSLMDASYGDLVLRQELMSGKKIHALAGELFFAPMTYEEILATKGLPGDLDKYARSKNGVFALFYGGEEYTLQTRVGLPPEVATKAYQSWLRKYKQWTEARNKIFDEFCTMSQPDGIGGRVIWKTPSNYIDNDFGFKRYFTIENAICKGLFDLGDNPPKSWRAFKFKVKRHDREQDAANAVRSACFGAAFQVQAAVMRAAANHKIQSKGAEVTKELQVDLWELQPKGIKRWIIVPMQVHDEIQVVTYDWKAFMIQDIIDAFLKRRRKIIPLLKIAWEHNQRHWVK